MKKLLLCAALVLPLAAGTCWRDLPEAEQERRIQIAAALVTGFVADYQAIYGPDWKADLEPEERLALLSGCRTLSAALLLWDDVPPEQVSTAMALCESLRVAPTVAPTPVPK